MLDTDQSSTEEIERQLARASYHTQAAHTRLSERMNEAEGYLFGLLDILMEKDMLSNDELQAKVKEVRDEIDKRAKQYSTGVALFPEQAIDFVDPEINCAERLHICKAACCRLSFPLSIADLEAGKVKWDYGKPYYIRHTENGRCVHLNQGNCQCGVYDSRPKVCKAYSCANDERIWLDFDKMILNEEWIETYCNGEKMVLKSNQRKTPEPKD